jgi:hypothetical protein
VDKIDDTEAGNGGSSSICDSSRSLLSVEDKKRVIIDSDNSLEGKLTMVKVRESIRMLGTNFFQEMTGVKKGIKSKVYDQSLLVTEDMEHAGDHEDQAHVAGHDEVMEDDFSLKI